MNYCTKKRNEYCDKVKMYVLPAWCEQVCKGVWKEGDPINPPSVFINPAAVPVQQAEMVNQLGLRQYASELLGAAKRAIKEKFKQVDEKTFAERLVCCTTCGGVQRCPYCGCFLEVKDRLASEKSCPNPQTYPHLQKYPPRNYWEVCERKTTAIVIGRNEPVEWFEKTIKSLFETATGKLEVIAVFDGYEIEPRINIDFHELKTIIKNPAVGRRKGINEAVKQATGDYIFIIDAHCRMSEGWDTKLKCACEEYTIAVATFKAMTEDFEKELPGHNYGFVYLNPDCIEKWHIQKMVMSAPLIEPMMGFTGCAWMIIKANYEQLGGYDESLGEYGYDGPEWSLKMQLDAGGRVVLRKDVVCWHLFGTNSKAKLYQPKMISGVEFKNVMVSKYSDRIGWLAAQFMPLPEWDSKAIIYGSSGPTIIRCLSRLGDLKVIATCGEHLEQIPIDKRVVTVVRRDDQPPSHKTYYEQILEGIDAAEDAAYIFIAEHDVLYDSSHFSFRPPRDDTFYFDMNVYSLIKEGYLRNSPGQVFSMMVAKRELLVQWLKHRINYLEEGGKINRTEPTIGDFTMDWSIKYLPIESGRTRRRPRAIFEPRGPKYYVEEYKADKPSIDVRHGGNFTGGRSGEIFEILEPWGDYREVWKELGIGL